MNSRLVIGIAVIVWSCAAAPEGRSAPPGESVWVRALTAAGFRCPPDVEPSARGFRRKRSLLWAAGGANHRGQDVVTPPDGRQILVGKIAYGIADKDLKEEDVDVLVQRGNVCTPWELLGVVRTSREGDLDAALLGTPDDGGRVLLEIPAPRHLPAGRHAVRLLVHGDRSAADFSLWVLPRGTEVAIFDVDGTLTTGDDELWEQLATEALGSPEQPDAWPGARDVVAAWAERGVLPVYLTGRPDTLRRLTVQWLREQGFPPGVVRLTDQMRQTVPVEAIIGRFKADVLTDLQGRAGLVVRAAYGNAATDRFAYRGAKIPDDRVHMVGDGLDWPSELVRVRGEPAAQVAAPRPAAW